MNFANAKDNYVLGSLIPFVLFLLALSEGMSQEPPLCTYYKGFLIEDTGTSLLVRLKYGSFLGHALHPLHISSYFMLPYLLELGLRDYHILKGTYLHIDNDNLASAKCTRHEIVFSSGTIAIARGFSFIQHFQP